MKKNKDRGSFVKRGKVWRSDRAQETARGPDRPRSSRVDVDEDSILQARALSNLGPGGYEKFGDIPAHKLGRNLRGDLYKVANSLPEDERQNLASRIKYAATTVTASLAAGFGEGTFRASVTRALESRGALLTIQDLLEAASEQGLTRPDTFSELLQAIEKTVSAVNDYLGRLAKERDNSQGSGRSS